MHKGRILVSSIIISVLTIHLITIVPSVTLKMLFVLFAILTICIGIYNVYQLEDTNLITSVLNLLLFGIYLALLYFNPVNLINQTILTKLFYGITITLGILNSIYTIIELWNKYEFGSMTRNYKYDNSNMAHTLQTQGKSTNWSQREYVQNQTKKD